MRPERKASFGSFREPLDELVVRVGRERKPPGNSADEKSTAQGQPGDWPPFLLNDCLAPKPRAKR